MKKIIFLVPPTDEKKIPDRLFGCNFAVFFQHNVFMLYPATLLQKEGYDVEVIDCVVGKKKLKYVLKKKADIYIFYSVFLSRKIDLEATEEILKTNKKAKFIFMGSDPSAKPENYIKANNYFVVRGEPEYTTLEIIKNIDRKEFSEIKGLSWMNDGKIIHNSYRDYIEDIDKLPFPNRNLFKEPFKYYNAKFKKLPSTTMVTSRNCSFRCYYCVPNSLSFARELEWKRWHKNKPPVTRRSVENIIKEFEEIAKQGYKSVFIIDDQFIWGKERTIEIFDGIKHLNLEISLLARPDLLVDEELVKKMVGAGVRHVDLGVESFNQEILDYINKDLDVNTIERGIKLLKKYKIDPEINVMFGSCPLETKKTMEDTIKKVQKMNVEVIHVSICTPFPGTEFRKKALREGWLTEKGDYRPVDPALDALIEYPHLSKKDMIKAVRGLYFRHFFNPKYLLKQLVKLKSREELKHKASTARNIWKKVIKK